MNNVRNKPFLSRLSIPLFFLPVFSKWKPHFYSWGRVGINSFRTCIDCKCLPMTTYFCVWDFMLGIDFQLQTCMLHIAHWVLHVESACINKDPHKTMKIGHAKKHIEHVHMKMALLTSAQGKTKNSAVRKQCHIYCVRAIYNILIHCNR